MTSNNLDMPEQLRKIAQKNIEQAAQAYGQFMNAMADAMEMWTGSLPSNDVTDAFKSLQDMSIRAAKENAEAGLEHAKNLANAKNLMEIVQLQTEFAKKQMDALTAQSQGFGARLFAAAKEPGSEDSTS